MKDFKNAGLRTVLVLGMIVTFTGCAQRQVRTDVPVPPKDAIVLFDGTDLSHWTDQSGGSVKWRIIGDAMEVVPQTPEDFAGKKPKKVGIQTKRKFQDFILRVEFNVPPGEEDNSGVYLQRRYEIQIVDSHAGRQQNNSCGAIYNQKQPDVNVSRKPGDWQSYDITFHAARFAEKDGQLQKIENARVSVLHNNVLIHDEVEILGKTGNGDEEGPEPAPILLQDHGSRTRFRDVWILPLQE